TGDFLTAKPRAGNIYTSNGGWSLCSPHCYTTMKPFGNDVLSLWRQWIRCAGALYGLSETKTVAYITRLKSNVILQHIANELHPSTSAYIIKYNNEYYQ